MMNKWIGIGRLCRDVELRFTPNTGNAVANFTLAIDRIGTDKGTDFIDIVVWNKQAENCAQYLAKGSLCAVDGRLQIRTYEAKDGQKRRVAEVVANSVQFLTPKGDSKDDSVAQAREIFTPDEDVPF